MSLTSEIKSNLLVKNFFSKNIDIGKFARDLNKQKNLNTIPFNLDSGNDISAYSTFGTVSEYIFDLKMGVPFVELMPVPYLMEPTSKYSSFLLNAIDVFNSNLLDIRHFNILCKLRTLEYHLRSNAFQIDNDEYFLQLFNPNFNIVNKSLLEDFEKITSIINVMVDTNFANADIYYNPVFHLSSMVGGADADFIKNDCLYEIKTSKDAKYKSDYLKQALGYVLLDENDEFAIKRIGLVLFRQNKVVDWSLEYILGNYSNYLNISEARKDFKAIYN